MKESNYMTVKDQRITKSNALIQESRFSLSLQQQKIILYLISQISPFDEEFHTMKFPIRDFCKLCGITADSGKNQADLKKAIKEIADKSMWLQTGDGKEVLVRWIESPTIDHKAGIVTLRLHKEMQPYLLQLKENFTTYELIFTLRFRSKYSIRLYELLSSIHYHTLDSYSHYFPLAELQRIIGSKCETWQKFKERALDPALEEINAYSNKTATYTIVKAGRPVAGVEITVCNKDARDMISLKLEAETVLGYLPEKNAGSQQQKEKNEK